MGNSLRRNPLKIDEGFFGLIFPFRLLITSKLSGQYFSQINGFFVSSTSTLFNLGIACIHFFSLLRVFRQSKSVDLFSFGILGIVSFSQYLILSPTSWKIGLLSRNKANSAHSCCHITSQLNISKPEY